MTADQFAYWLQGFAEIHGEPPTAAQWAVIQDHLKLVFVKVTPTYVQAAGGAGGAVWPPNAPIPHVRVGAQC